MTKYQTIARMIMALAIVMFPLLHAHAWDWEWTDTWGEAVATCGECGAEYTIYAESSAEAEEAAADLFCDDCGSCLQDVNADCYREHHCQYCSNCIDNGEYHEGLYNKFDEYICYDCADELIESGTFTEACRYCHEIFGEGAVECDCEYDMLEHHCKDCSELQCSVCGICLVIDGEDTEALGGDACEDHAICGNCMADAAAEDLIHCRECFMCDEDICSECGLCESCAEGEEHCPECGHCFGDEVQWCTDGGDHCIFCCEDNEWKCGQCGKCTEGAGLDLCDDCELCESCCHENSESEGCGHGYCIASADYEDHLCPECEQCPEDEECEYCGLCASCQEDYHCEHELCPDSPDFDDHVCPDCGNCFDEGELCEYCGLCPDCQEHCEHGVCPENDDDGDHFICDQCGDCYEGVDRCDCCELCLDCCADNTSSMGCDHDLCIESDEFAEHWCYEDDQCLELCQHDAECEHQNVSSTWRIDGNAHWLVCEDCGIALNKAIHTEGTPVTLTAANPSTHTNGTAQVNCEVCNYKMGIISIPYYEVSADGKPYIIIQPTDYTGKTNTTAWTNNDDPYATFKVKAGGEGLSYQWYEQYGTGTAQPLTDSWKAEGAQTATLKALVLTDECETQNYHKYYCVVSNTNGSVTSNVAYLNAQHVFGRYMAKDSETHENCCYGECGVVKNTSKHRFSEWTLVRPATSTETGLREQTCLDCSYKNTEVIPKVDPNHVHSFDIAKYSITQHWFVCVCGLASPDPAVGHNFDQTEVITEATEKKPGENKEICSACGYSKTVKTDKLPHTHDWYSFSEIEITINGRYVPDPEKGGWGPESHHVKCKVCDQIKTENHVWPMWECTKDAKSEDEPGKLVRYCEECGYEQVQYFPYGTWPIMIEGGTANKAYAKAGTQILITFDPKAARKMTNQDKPVKFKKWYDGTQWTGYTNIPWDGGRSDIDLPRITFMKPFNKATLFIMPNGPATVFAGTEECDHTGNTKLGKRVEPTCAGYGHEPNTLCSDCDEVLVEGARIPALGHDLPDTPIAGTEDIEYCTIWSQYGYNNGIPNTATHGWSGDFLCNRCGKTVKSEKTPLRHGLWDKNNQYGPNPGKIWTDYQKWEPSANPPTCTRAGHDDNLYCKYCNKLVQKGEREEALGHEWGEWETIREATTKIKGMEQRVCERDETHIETRITDYSGPDYSLKPDKTKLRFEWTYGQQPTPQTITFKSTGRDNIQTLTYAIEENDLADVNFEGLTLTITPKNIVEDYESALTFDIRSLDENGETIYLSSPEISLTCIVKKTEEKYTLTVEDGVATTGTLVGNNYVLDTNTSSKLQVRGGVPIRLEPEDQWRKDFLHWEVVEDASNLLRDEYDVERAGGWGPSTSPTYGNRWTYMSPNNVTVRAIYKKNEPTMAFSETAVTANMDIPFMEPRLRTTPGGLKVTYSSSNGSVANVNPQTGEISFLKAGITTITATFDGNAHYLPATATYTLTVPQDFIDGVSNVNANVNLNEGTYNLAGQRVSEKYKGIVITNGRKLLKK
ncbi:MAG: Ig-like domain repeat protein [Bacteroidaceae bacterium]|nr:Ig-like domain repeat protein [Bacteroidaceae bacterium]